MKTKISSIIILSVLAFIVSACNVSFTTAKIGSLNFGKNQSTTPAATTFDAGEKIFAVANVTGAIGKNKLKFNVMAENVPGHPKGESAFSKDIEIEGSVPAGISVSLPLAGEYKIESTLSDESGKEIDKKSGNVTVKGGAPAPAASTDAKKDDADHDTDDK